MPLRAVLRYLMNNEQLIQKLAESYPIRRAAQLTSYMFHKGKELGEEGIEKLQETDAAHRMKQGVEESRRKVSRFQDTFSKELEKGWEDLNQKRKKDG